jgi:hypothetical protein
MRCDDLLTSDNASDARPQMPTYFPGGVSFASIARVSSAWQTSCNTGKSTCTNLFPCSHEHLSQKALRIDVDLELELALRFRCCREPIPQIA